MLEFYTFGERPDLVSRWVEQRDPWAGMEWMYHDPICEHYWPNLSDDSADFQFLVYDVERDSILGEGRTIPFRWSGDEEELPDGVDDVLPRACERAEEPNSLCAILAVVESSGRAKGVSAEILRHMRSIAKDKDYESVAAPVRPNHKHRYPLTPIERYALWRRDDGLLFDPWMRTHERLGAREAGTCPRSNVFVGTVAEWEQWTNLRFLESGEYLAAGMMNPFHIDLTADLGTYTEANVWMIHEL